MWVRTAAERSEEPYLPAQDSPTIAIPICFLTPLQDTAVTDSRGRERTAPAEEPVQSTKPWQFRGPSPSAHNLHGRLNMLSRGQEPF